MNNKKIVIIYGLSFLAIVLLFTLCYWYKETNNLPSDSNLSRLNSKQEIPWGIREIKVASVWPYTTGKGVKVAIMDSGFDYQHPDLKGNIKNGINLIDPSQPPTDDYGHGTFVSGILAAQNNSFGVVGIAPDVDLYPLKVLDNHGKGDISNIIAGIDWCIRNKIQIINMSFSFPQDNPLLHSYVTKAFDSGIIMVAAASNNDSGEVRYPAAYSEVISVTSVNENFKVPQITPCGKIDFAAPGINVLTTNINGGYTQTIGTSLAAPYITGIISLILQNPREFGLPNNWTYPALYNKLGSVTFIV